VQRRVRKALDNRTDLQIARKTIDSKRRHAAATCAT
jgi:hypothetical protein